MAARTAWSATVMPWTPAILAAAKGSKYGVQSLIHAIVQSELFRNK